MTTARDLFIYEHQQQFVHKSETYHGEDCGDENAEN